MHTQLIFILHADSCHKAVLVNFNKNNKCCMIPKSCMIPIKQIQTYIYFTLWGFLNLIAVLKCVFSFGPIVQPGSNQDHAVLRITRGPTGQRTIIHRLTYRERVIFGWTSPTPSSLAMPLVGLEQVICLRQPCQLHSPLLQWLLHCHWGFQGGKEMVD